MTKAITMTMLRQGIVEARSSTPLRRRTETLMEILNEVLANQDLSLADAGLLSLSIPGSVAAQDVMPSHDRHTRDLELRP